MELNNGLSLLRGYDGVTRVTHGLVIQLPVTMKIFDVSPKMAKGFRSLYRRSLEFRAKANSLQLPSDDI